MGHINYEYYGEIIFHEFFPEITLPTRFYNTANTPIDNIFATNNEINDISDIGSPNGVHLC